MFLKKYFSLIFFFNEVQLIYKLVLVSGVQQSDSVTHVYTHFFFHILFHYGLLYDIEYTYLPVLDKDLIVYFIYSVNLIFK